MCLASGKVLTGGSGRRGLRKPRSQSRSRITTSPEHGVPFAVNRETNVLWFDLVGFTRIERVSANGANGLEYTVLGSRWMDCIGRRGRRPSVSGNRESTTWPVKPRGKRRASWATSEFQYLVNIVNLLEVSPTDVSPRDRQRNLGLPSRLGSPHLYSENMTVQNLSAQPPFITKDGSTIRSIETRSLPTSLAATHRGFAFYVAFPKSSGSDCTNAPVQNQSLAEARVAAGGRTERHYHK